MPLLKERITAPLEVSFNATIGDCDWATITEQRLGQKYSDMIIKQVKPNGEQLKFHVELRDGNNDESLVRERFYQFLRGYPSMKIWGLDFKAIVQ